MLLQLTYRQDLHAYGLRQIIQAVNFVQPPYINFQFLYSQVSGGSVQVNSPSQIQLSVRYSPMNLHLLPCERTYESGLGSTQLLKRHLDLTQAEHLCSMTGFQDRERQQQDSFGNTSQ